MRRAIVFVVLLFAIVLWAQEASRIAVKSSVVSNGVVIVSAQEGKAHFDLQCNQDMMNCNKLAAGSYWMTRLPKNRGMYDCADVRVYAESSDPKSDSPVGEYCLIQQK